jgi:hypothetical protein
MYRSRVGDEKKSSKGKKSEPTQEHWDRRALESRAVKRERLNMFQVAPITPEKVGILIYDEKLRGESVSQPPFPLGHDGIASG